MAIFEKIKYTQDSEGHKWIGIEALPEQGESPDEVFKQIQGKVKQWHGGPSWSHSVSHSFGVVDTEHASPIDRLTADINSCVDIKVLETYKLLIKTNKELQEVYNKKLAELSK